MLNLKLGKSTLFHSSGSIYRSLTPSDIAQVLYRCRENLQMGLKFIELLSSNCPHFQHSMISLCAMVHMLVRGKRVSEAQALILRMVRRSGVSRVEVVDCFLQSCDKCGSNSGVFDLLLRTYVQARRLREASEVFNILVSRGVCISINASNSLLGGLVKVGWVDLAWVIYGEVVKNGVQVNVYTLNIMVNALCKDGKTAKVNSFFVRNGSKRDSS